MKMMSVMRDIYADIPGYDKYKINAAYSLEAGIVKKNT